MRGATVSHLPGQKWIFAELIEEVSVVGFPRNVVHRNESFIYANSAEEAYAKAFTGEDLPHPHQHDSRLVTTRFWRLGELNGVGHGSELFAVA